MILCCCCLACSSKICSENVSTTEDMVTVRWIPEANATYQLNVRPRPVNGDTKTINVDSNVLSNDGFASQTINGLLFGTNYELTLQKKTAPIATVLQCVFYTEPGRVRNLRRLSSTSNSIQISFTRPVSGSISGYRLYIGNKEFDLNRNVNQRTVSNLQPGTVYKIIIKSLLMAGWRLHFSQPVTLENVTTKPESASNLRMVSSTSNSIKISWAAPVSGGYTGYKLSVNDEVIAIDWNDNKYTFENLEPGTIYEITITTVFRVNGSDLYSRPATLDDVATKPGIVTNLRKVSSTSNSISISWDDPVSAHLIRYKLSLSNGDADREYLNQHTTEYTFTNLQPGTIHQITIRTVLSVGGTNIDSQPVTLDNVATNPQAVSHLSLTNVKQSLNVEWQRSLPSDTQQTFRISYSPSLPEDSSPRRSEQTSSLSFVLQGVTPGELYEVNVSAVKNFLYSEPIADEIVIDPSNVVVTFTPKERQINVLLVSQEGRATGYDVQCRSSENGDCGRQTSSRLTSFSFQSLSPYHNYSFYMQTNVTWPGHDSKVVQATYIQQTLEDAPGVVQQLTVSDVDLRMVLVSWSPPVVSNGQLNQYRITYAGTYLSREPDPGDTTIVMSSETQVQLEGLNAGYDYNFQVMAFTVRWGPVVDYNITLITGVPSFQDGLSAESSQPVLSEDVEIGERTFSVLLINAFSDTNGPIEYYAVIVANDPSVPSESSTSLSWRDVQESSSKVYQATPNCTDWFSVKSMCGRSGSPVAGSMGKLNRTVFQLGVQSEEECIDVANCNGPLQPNTGYYVKVRAFTESGFTDTAYSSKIRTANLTPLRVGIAVGVVLGLAVSIAAVLLAIWSVKIVLENHWNKRDGQMGGALQLDTLPMNNVVRNAIKLKDFSDHVYQMSSEAGMLFADEYESLKAVGASHKKCAAELAVNSSKNRYSNVLPYDHSRVKLVATQEHDGSDYINANYVPGYASDWEYIAAQGPLSSTVNDFWRMVWEQGVTNIVMLTKCVEKNMEKCFQYWPSETGTKHFGNVEVVLMNETLLPDWSITEFCISLNSDSRRVRHFHFKAWPDFGVPEDHSVLIQFVETVRGKLASDSGPIVIHCSAGVGRTGTYIVLDWSLHAIREKDELNIFQIVCTLREHRVLMVQTEQQYKFVHECVARALKRDDGYGDNGEAQYVNVGGLENSGFDGDKEENPYVNM